jgi:hypothetical protein
MVTKGRLSIAAVAALISIGGTAEAGVLTAGPAYISVGGSNGRVVCWLFNTGTTPVTVFSRRIFAYDSGNTNSLLPVTSDACENPLGADRGCQFSASTGPFVGAYTCKAVVTGVEEDVSGTMQVMSPTGQVLLTVPLE